MASVQRGLLLAALTVSAWAQTEAPFISREGVLPAKGPQWLEPGQFVEIYGKHLAPKDGCFEKLESKAGSYPTDACDTHVTVNGIRAGLQFIGEGQINIKLPAGIPSRGIVTIVVAVQGASSQEVAVPIGKPKLILSVLGRAYVHMPVWIAHNVPVAYRDPIQFPVGPNATGFEVRRNGVTLKPLEIRMAVGIGSLIGNEISAETPLPLHLQYRFDEPGSYEIRYTVTRMDADPQRGIRTVVAEQSDWTSIDVEPFSVAQRSKWLRERAREMPSSPEQLIAKALPELLALPDASALSVILPYLYHPEESVRRYVAASLGIFDDAVVAKQLTPIIREKGPTQEIARLLDGTENLFEGGHSAFLMLLPKFLNSSSSLAKAGVLQYIIWEPNHDWGKETQIETRRVMLLMNAAPGILQHGDADLYQLLALALGSVKTDASRAMLWQMIAENKAAEQSKIALTWIGDARDLSRLAGVMDSSLPYALHRAYGAAALPFLRKNARETDRPELRLTCARELVIAGEPDGLQFLSQAMDQVPSFRSEAVQLVRDQFPELRSVDEGKVLDFLRRHATTGR